MSAVPVWVLVIAGLFVLAPIAISVMGYMSPKKIFADMEASAFSLSGPMGMYLSRNIATPLIMIVALFRGDPNMLLSAFLLRLFTDVLDIVNTMAGGAKFPVAFLGFVILSIPCVWVLW